MCFTGKKEDEAAGWEEKLREWRVVGGEFFRVGPGIVGSAVTEKFDIDEVDDFEAVDHVLQVDGAGMVFPSAELPRLGRVAVDVDDPAGFAEFVNSLRDGGGVVAHPEERLEEERRVEERLPAGGVGKTSDKHRRKI